MSAHSAVIGSGAAIAALRRAGRQADETIDLAETALALAQLAHPTVDAAPYRTHLAELTSALGEVSARLDSDDIISSRRVGGQLQALCEVLVERYGYAGDRDSYDDLANADLMRVIDRRKGLPVALSILWLHAARSQGWAMSGLNFPGHFLLRLEGEDGRAIIDPFAGGRVLDPTTMRELIKSLAGPEAELRPEHYQPIGNRAILLRLQNNIKLRLLKDSRTEAAIEVLERMVLLAPDDAGLWQEVGALQATIGNLRAALVSLDQARQLSSDAAAKRRLDQALAEIRTRLN